MTFILDRYHRSAAAVAPVWYEYDVQNVTFDNDEKWGKYRNVGSWFSNYHPCLTQAPLKKKKKKKKHKKNNGIRSISCKSFIVPWMTHWQSWVTQVINKINQELSPLKIIAVHNFIVGCIIYVYDIYIYIYIFGVYMVSIWVVGLVIVNTRSFKVLLN